MPVDPQLSAHLRNEKADFEMPSAEGQGGYPADLLELSKEQLEALLRSQAPNGNGNSGWASADEGPHETQDEHAG